MPAHHRRVSSWLLAGVGLATACCISLHASPAQAQEPGIDASGKGITGGALLGGELVVATQSLFGVKPAWAYLIGGVAGAAGGGVAGYFVEQADNPKPAYYMLAAGMALVIPTTVLVLQRTSYQPPDQYTEDQPGPDAEPMPLGGPVSRPTRTGQVATAARPPAVLDLDSSQLRLSVPAVQLVPTYSARELRTYGLSQQSEWRVPVFHAVF